jgi:beta-galactosidase
VFSDRSPKPHYPEMKRAYQWIGIEPEDLAAGSIRIRNKYSFLNLDKFEGKWVVSENGKPVEGGRFRIGWLAPGSDTLMKTSWRQITANPGSEYHIRISFSLTNDEKWAKAGFEVASAQFALPIKTTSLVKKTSEMPYVSLSQDDREIVIAGKDFSVVFDKGQGTLSKLVRDGKNLLLPEGGPRLQLWRAPHRDDDMWAYKDWNSAGLNRLKFSALSVTASQPGPAVARVETVVKAEGSDRFMATHSAVYTVYGDGSIAVDNSVVPQGNRIALARMGVRLQLDKALDRFDFYGRGPMENYADRKRGFDVGQYGSSVKNQMTPYAKPMECGNHEDVRWAALSGTNMPTLLAQPDGGLMQASALPYTDEVMAPVEYRIDLPPSAGVSLVLASQTLGVGSAGCGPRPLDKYIVWSDPAVFSYVLRLLPPGAKRFSDVARFQVPQDRVKPILFSLKGGLLDLSCETRGGKIEYSTNGTTWANYEGPVADLPAELVSARATAKDLMPFQGGAVLKSAAK